MFSQTLLNLIALSVLGAVSLSRVSVLDGHDRGLVLIAVAPLAALLVALAAPVLIPPSAVSRFRRLQAAIVAARRALLRLRQGLAVFRPPRAAGRAGGAQLRARALQVLSCA